VCYLTASAELSTVVLVIVAIFPAIWSAIRASRILFHKMLDSVLRSPTRFFDRTPAGRTLARFSKGVFVLRLALISCGTHSV